MDESQPTTSVSRLVTAKARIFGPSVRIELVGVALPFLGRYMLTASARAQQAAELDTMRVATVAVGGGRRHGGAARSDGVVARVGAWRGAEQDEQ